MHPRNFLGWLMAAGLLASLLAPASALADAFTSWTPGPDAVGDNTYAGFIDIPATNATVGTGNFTVAGWFVDQTAEGWAGADDIQIWLGTMDGGGKLLTKATFAQNRPDVADATGNPFWAPSGFGGAVPSGTLPTGPQTLSVYAHTPSKGWWYKQVAVNVSASVAAPAPAPPLGASPGAAPVLVIESPTAGQNIGTKDPFTMNGYALDPNAAIGQGSQNSGVDRVSLYIDKERDNGGTFVGDADLAFSDNAAAAKYGSQFANSGWRLTFKATKFHSGSHTLFFYAHSAATGKEDLETIGINIVENG